MIVNELYNGSGLGNQLWYYAVTRTIALDNGYDFGIMSPEKFKGLNLFENIDFGKSVEGGSGPEGGPPVSLPVGIDKYYREKKTINPVYACDVSVFDSGLINVGDNTKIDGNMQSEDYILHRKKEIKEWLRIKNIQNSNELSDGKTCIINLRGGEYRGVSELFLEKSYFYNAIKHMKDLVGIDLRFVVVTDDIEVSKEYFPDFEVYNKSIEWDYSVLHKAKYLIISNSSFAWFPSWTSEVNEITIAPKYWARHNVSDGFWSCGDSLTREWLWTDRGGNIFDYEQCLIEKERYNA